MTPIMHLIAITVTILLLAAAALPAYEYKEYSSAAKGQPEHDWQ